MVKNNLKELAKSKDISLYRLAIIAGLDYSAVKKMSNNKTQSISYLTLDKICKALNCNISDILIFENDEINK